jgi:molybdopterin/thiamine biosynthesis adenylyltransferase/molybdopterin synthase catalytic subunit/rhodanese-related sulfurtransferase
LSFRLSSEPIAGPLLDPETSAGGIVVFEGRVRSSNEGKKVLSLEYEAYGALAEKEGSRVVEEALARFPLTAAACVHRAGHLQLGEVAIRVEVAAGHRREAFAACEWIVDEIKKRVPVWKKEHYADGPSEWLDPTSKTTSEQEIYSRQTRLPEVGEAGQEKLRSARVLIVGAGGLGSPAAFYLAAAGVGSIGIAEGDVLEASNLHRQVLYSARDVGQPKSELARRRLQELNPLVQVTTLGRLTAANADETLTSYDLVLDCTDSFRSKFLINEACVRLGKSLIQASIYQYEGSLLAVTPGGPCLSCLWPERPVEDCVGSCAEVGVLGAVPGVFGSLQAMEALKLLLGLPSPLTEGKMVLFNLLTLETRQIKVGKRPACPACGDSAVQRFMPLEVVASTRGELGQFVLVDIRDEDERQNDPIPLPHKLIEHWRPNGKTALLICQRGMRSADMAESIADASVGFLRGGMEDLRRLLSS